MTHIPAREREPGTELVSTNGSLPTADDFARGRHAIERLRDEGDTAGLHQGSQAARLAAQHYRVVLKNKEIAKKFARLKIEAECALGTLDIERAPRARGWPRIPFPIGDALAHEDERRDWRTLAIAHERGMLEPILTEMEGDPAAELALYWVTGRLAKAAACWCSRKELREAFEYCELSMAEVGRRAGLPKSSVSGALGTWGETHHGEAILYLTAAAIADVLGVPRRKLRPMKSTCGSTAVRRARRRAAATAALKREERRKAAKKLGGKIDVALTLAIRLCETLGAARERFPKGSEQREHADRAYYKATEAEQEIGLVLGIA